MLAFFLTTWATQRTLPSIAGIYVCTAPLWSSLFGAMFIGEELGLYDLFGGVLIVSGVATVRQPACFRSSTDLLYFFAFR